MLVKQTIKPLSEDTGPLPLHTHNNGRITIDRKERFSNGLRWKLGINTNPCIQLRNGKRCIFCGFLTYSNPVSPSKVGEVFNEAFRNSDLSDIHRLELYVSGSFFDNKEVSFNSRLEIIKSINESGIKEVVLESRPEFVTEENLEPLANIIAPKKITIAVGVETMDDGLRDKLSKGFSTKDIVKSLSSIARARMNFQAYLLLNPPTINNDKNAIIDIVNSSRKLISLAEKMDCQLILAIQPFFIARNSIVAKYTPQKNSVRPPWLYTIALTLRLLDAIIIREKSNLRVILGNENDNVDPVLIPSNYTDDRDICPCTKKAKKHLYETNISQKRRKEGVRRVLESTCDCKKIWETEIGTYRFIANL